MLRPVGVVVYKQCPTNQDLRHFIYHILVFDSANTTADWLSMALRGSYKSAGFTSIILDLTSKLGEIKHAVNIHLSSRLPFFAPQARYCFDSARYGGISILRTQIRGPNSTYWGACLPCGTLQYEQFTISIRTLTLGRAFVR